MPNLLDPFPSAAPIRQRSQTDGQLAVFNTLLWFSILVVSGLFQSEIGGPDSYYNAIDVGLIGLFILANRRFDVPLVLAFAIPASFVLLSVVGNIDSMTPGGYRTAGATVMGLAFLTLKPVPLHHGLLRILVILALVVAAALSVQVSISRQLIDFSQELANTNFNVNPNAAAVFFVECLILALVFVPTALGWVLSVTFILLTITTASRAGAICSAIALVGYAIFAEVRSSKAVSRLGRRLRTTWKVWAVSALAIVATARFIPDALDFLMLRFEVAGSRSSQWDENLAAIQTWRQYLWGLGPTGLADRAAAGSHSSYIEAIGNSGFPFLVTLIIAYAIWLRRLTREGSGDLIWISLTIFTYGIVEIILFNGIGNLWLLIMLLGLVFRSRAAGMDASPSLSRAAATLAPTRPLVRSVK